MRKYFLGVVAAALAFGGCSSDSKTTNKDGGTKPDSSTSTDSGVVPPTSLTCNGDCKDFVISRLLLPKDSTESGKYAYDFDNDGTKDNALGGILSALAPFLQGTNLQDVVDEAVNQGTALVLFRYQGGDFKNAPKAALQTWLGKQRDCCQTKNDPVKCATEAQQTCFSGTAKFEPDPTASGQSLFGGRIENELAEFGPASISISLPLSGGTPLKISLIGARVRTTFKNGAIESGVIAGGITQTDLNNELLPAIAKLLDDQVLDESPENKKTRDTLLGLFDKPKGNGDKRISLDEVKDNDLIKSFLRGDVDVDGDGTDELSLGVAFNAAGAEVLSGSTPDAGMTADSSVATDAGVVADAKSGD